MPDTAAFNAANNSRALRFAIKAIAAQPLGYADVVAKEAVLPFIRISNALRFRTTEKADAPPPPPDDLPYALAAVRAYSGETATVRQIIHHSYATQLRQPYTSLMGVYQRVFFLPGPLLGLMMLAGLAGILMPRRRTAASVLLWVSALVIIMLPIAEHEYSYRYVIQAVPLISITAALAFTETTVRESAPRQSAPKHAGRPPRTQLSVATKPTR